MYHNRQLAVVRSCMQNEHARKRWVTNAKMTHRKIKLGEEIISLYQNYGHVMLPKPSVGSAVCGELNKTI